MPFDFATPPILCLAASVLCAVTGSLALARDIRSPAYRAFALGMAVFMAETLLSFFSRNAVLSERAVMWSRWQMAAEALIPGAWLLFSLGYARDNFDEFSRKWKWVIVFAFVAPIGLVSSGWTHLLGGGAIPAGSGGWIIPLGRSGYGLQVTLLIGSVLVLANLEKTLRTSSGAIRVQIELSILGTAALFAERIYSSVEILLFSALRTDAFTLNAVILTGANALLIVSALRNRLREVKLTVSQDVLHGSLTILVIGLYLLAVGLFAKLAVQFKIGRALFENGLIIIAAISGAILLLFSVKIRHRIRRFIHVHLRRPAYDYRKIWTDFTRKTSSAIDLDRVCAAIVNTVSETFAASVVTIWLFTEGFDRPAMAASTGSQPKDADKFHEPAASLLRFARDRRGPIEIGCADVGEIPGVSRQYLERAKIDCCVPLGTGSAFIGMLTLNSPTDSQFCAEDLDLLQTFADQAAGLIINRKLFENLGQARELEAVQAVSAFFAHDLKNVASTLALTLDNLPAHYSDPEFRADTLTIMSKSLEKIRNMCSRLSPLDNKFELELSECDVNELVFSTVSGLNFGCPLVCDPGPLPKARLDPEQIRKVLLNLVLNGCQSSAGGSEIRISTGREGEFVRLSVTDRGCGMSRDFMRKNLFRPFKTTKKNGSGIGLYQSKMIVEAHGGRIEVRSCEGRGSTFSVLLPLAGPS
ncbi:MAG: PEP-CTERM system histidine kinase PrsK [Syntrophobacteraceae bacterium]|nr:PEP-CTERM system histidine kinase PrsK [Syntrophobacteraceae bacterium]